MDNDLSVLVALAQGPIAIALFPDALAQPPIAIAPYPLTDPAVG